MPSIHRYHSSHQLITKSIRTRTRTTDVCKYVPLVALHGGEPDLADPEWLIFRKGNQTSKAYELSAATKLKQ